MTSKSRPDSGNGESAENKSEKAQLSIQKVYMKGLSFDAADTPSVFKKKWEPELALNLNTEHTELEDNVYEMVLTVTATVKNQNNEAFKVEIKQAGIFNIQGATEEQLGQLLGSYCPNVLFPYAREAITTEVMRAGFPQLVLSPINFDAVYKKQLEEKGKMAAGMDESDSAA
jgi:preprotein translocase subunit SecB